MYIVNCIKHGKSDIVLELIHELGMDKHIHWLNPLLFIRKIN